MRIAILGAGTAGYIAAAHLTRTLPQAELVHVFDSSISTIGVGEGTTPRFPLWLEEITGLRLPDLVERCGATLKTGTRFEGWGRAGHDFVNRFQPTRLIGYHFDAAGLVQVLVEHVRARRIDARITALDPEPGCVRVWLADGAAIDCDYVFDARGFPAEVRAEGVARGARAGASDETFIHLPWIPTRRATLRRIAPRPADEVTRAVARPHGWIFRIPLAGWTSCGYLHDPRISSEDEVEADFTAYLAGEGVSEWEARGSIGFPNFLRRRPLEDRVFRVGNAASFTEPLEATAICTAIVQIRAAVRWIDRHDADGADDPGTAEAYSAAIRRYVLRNSLFLAWHYVCGARWDTAFWRQARDVLDRAAADPDAAPHLAEMGEFVDLGRDLPGLDLPACGDQATWDREVFPLLRRYTPFGNFSELNFAQIGHGLGYYQVLGGSKSVAPAGAHG